MFEGIVLGLVQGVAEWLPVSSEGMIVLVKTHFFGGESLVESVHLALFLHLGTFFAALVYFWKDILVLLQTVLNYKRVSSDEKVLLHFLFLATLISGTFGFGLLKLVEGYEETLMSSGSAISVLVGLMLLVTGGLLLSKKTQTTRGEKELTIQDGVVLGITQGFAALPGLSRSGLTVSVLLLRHISEQQALRLSFLMSLPIVLAGNIILNMGSLTVTLELLVGLVAAFISGLLTIHILLKVARKINFGKFVIGFGLLMVLSAFV